MVKSMLTKDLQSNNNINLIGIHVSFHFSVDENKIKNVFLEKKHTQK